MDQKKQNGKSPNNEPAGSNNSILSMLDSEQIYKSVLDNIGVGIALISPDMEILFLNSKMKSWFPKIDVSRHPVCYKSFNNPPSEKICHYCPTCKTLKDGLVHEATTETPTNKTIVNYRVVSSPIKDKEGNILAAIEMVDDITVQKKLSEQLETFRRFAETSSEGMAIISLQGDILYLNPAMRGILKTEKHQELEGQSFFSYHEEKSQTLLQDDIIPEVLIKGYWQGHLKLAAANNEILSAVENIFLIRDEKGKPQRLGSVINLIN